RQFEVSWQSGAVPFALSPDGKVVASPEGCAVRTWDLATGKERSESPRLDTLGQTFAPDGKTIVTNGTPLALWATATGRRLWEAPGEIYIHSSAFAPDGKVLVTGNHPVRFWRPATGELLRTVADAVRGTPHFSTDGKTVSVLGDGRVVTLDREGKVAPS